MKNAFKHSTGTNQEAKEVAVKFQRRSEWLAAVEFGYKQCEKGHNLDAAMENAQNIYDQP